MNGIAAARALTLTGYFGLLGLLLCWNAWLSPPEHLPVALVLIALVVPLLFPLRGLLHGKPYTHSWVTFLAIFYLMLGLGEAVAGPTERSLAILEVIFSLMLLAGASWYVRAQPPQRAPGE